MILLQIMDRGPGMTWDDIAGLEFAKKTIKEIVVWPMLRPCVSNKLFTLNSREVLCFLC